MGRVINQTIWNNISAYMGVVLGAINTLVLYPWAFSANPEYLGLVNLILSYAMVVSTFTQLGAPNLILRYYAAYSEKGKKQLFGFGILLPLIGIALFSLFYFIYQEPFLNWLADDELVHQYGYLLIPLIIFNVYVEVFSAISQSYIRTVFPLFLKEVFRRILASALLLIYFTGWLDLTQFMVLFTIGYALQFGLLVVFLLRNNYLQLSFAWSELKVRKLLDYGLFVFLIAGGNLLIGRIDMIMIGKLAPDALVNVAKYSIAFFMAGVINTPNKSLSAIARPLLSKAWEANDMDQIQFIYKRSSLNQLIFAGLLFVLIWNSVSPIFQLLPEKFRGGEYAFLFLGLARVYSMATGVNGMIISSSSHYRFNLFSNLALIVSALILNVWLIPLYGLEGAAIATLISFIVDNTSKVVYLWIKMKILPFNREFFIVLALLIIGVVLGVILPDTKYFIVTIMYKTAIVGALLGFAIYKLNLSEEINGIINKQLARFRK
jgi:O-antigen/teichoic acid export membrane protein